MTPDGAPPYAGLIATGALSVRRARFCPVTIAVFLTRRKAKPRWARVTTFRRSTLPGAM